MCCNGCWQGSHWSRRNRMFVMHDSRPQLLTTLVSPSDVMAFGGEDPSARYVLYSDARKAAWVTELREGVKVSLKRAESDLITIVPLRQLKGLSLAPIGATLAWQCERQHMLAHANICHAVTCPSCSIGGVDHCDLSRSMLVPGLYIMVDAL